MDILKHEGNEYRQEIYLCRQIMPDSKIHYNVGLTWTPINENWEPYCQEDLPPTLDNGEASKIFTGRERNKAIKYANELIENYNLNIKMSLI